MYLRRGDIHMTSTLRQGGGVREKWDVIGRRGEGGGGGGG